MTPEPLAAGAAKVSEMASDISGSKIGRLDVISVARTSKKHVFYNCICECGNKTIVQDTNLLSGHSRSCGCLRRELHTKHGFSKTRTYSIWKGMIHRCTNIKHSNYPFYGGVGIKVDPRWMNGSSFIEDMGEAPYGMTIDRIDTRGNYEPGNCRWATMKQQENNRTNNKIISYDNESMTIAQASEKYGIPWSTLNNRIFVYGWSVERALNTPARAK